MSLRILFLAANPSDKARLNLDTEYRDIAECISLSKYSKSIQLVPKWAVRKRDIATALLEVQPTIVHFSGHGDPSGEIIVADEENNSHLLETHREFVWTALVAIMPRLRRPQTAADWHHLELNPVAIDVSKQLALE